MNDLANIKLTITASEIQPVIHLAQAEHTSRSLGTVAVPLRTPAGTEIDIPFGAVKNATCASLLNGTSVPVDLLINGAKTHAIAPGGFAVFGGSVVEGGELKSISVTTTKDQEGAPIEKLVFAVFGDPVAPPKA